MDSCGRAQEGTRVWFGSQVPLLTVPGWEPLRQTGAGPKYESYPWPTALLRCRHVGL